MVGAHRLPLRFDTEPLAREARAVDADAAWCTRGSADEGAWSVLALISPDGDPQAIHSRGARLGAPTPICRSSPALRGAIETFQAPVVHARLNRLRPGAAIPPHRDYGDQRWSYERGYVRIHVPLITDEGVSFFVDGDRIGMQPGEAWYIDVCRRHGVENRSGVACVHLVLDLALNDWLSRLFPRPRLVDELRGLVLRRFEGPLWRLAKPLVTRLPGRRHAGTTEPSRGRAESAE